MNIPNWSCYYKDGDANALRFDVGLYTFWYSYKTLIAFRAPGHPVVVHENDWSPTTAKHLNKIERLGDRVDHATFERLLKKLVEPYFETVQG